MVRKLMVLVWLALAGSVVATPAAAQTADRAAAVEEEVVAAVPEAAAPSAAEVLQPTMASALFAPHSSFASLAEPAPGPGPRVAARGGSGVPLMAAGGVLFVAGAIIGGDAGVLLMVGGAGVGAYGVYQYTR